jgi:hypothetical protein
VRDLPEDPILQRAVAKLNGAELPLISLALIGEAGKPAARRFLEFFTVNIRNRNPRAACARTAAEFLHWCGPGYCRPGCCRAGACGGLRRAARLHDVASVRGATSRLSLASSSSRSQFALSREGNRHRRLCRSLTLSLMMSRSQVNRKAIHSTRFLISTSRLTPIIPASQKSLVPHIRMRTAANDR